MIKEVWISEPIVDIHHDTADVILTLDDGRSYSFTAWTPQSLSDYFEREGQSCLICEDLLVVRELTPETIRAAMERLAANYDLERYGIRQSEE